MALLVAACLTFINPFTGQTQQAYTDSLYSAFENTTLSDSHRLKAIDLLGWHILNLDKDSSKVLAKKQLVYARAAGDLYFELKSLSLLSEVYWMEGRSDSFKLTVLERYRICDQFDPGPRVLTRVHVDMTLLAIQEQRANDGYTHAVSSLALVKAADRGVAGLDYKGRILATSCHMASRLDDGLSAIDSLRAEGLVTEYQAGYVYKGAGRKLGEMGEFDWARKYFDAARVAFGSIQDSLHQVMVFETRHQQALLLHRHGDFEAAVDSLKALVDIIIKSDQAHLLAQNYMQIGFEEKILGQTSTALQWFLRALENAEEFNNTKEQADAHFRIGEVYHEFEDFENAGIHLNRSLELCNEHGYLVIKGPVLRSLGLLAEADGRMDDALPLYEESYQIFKYADANTGSILNTIGQHYKKRNEFDRAVEMMKKALEEYERRNDKYGIAWMLVNIGSLYEQTGRYPLALQYCTKAEPMMQEMDDLRGQKMICDCLALTYGGLGQFEQGYDYAVCYIRKMIQTNYEATEDLARQWEFDQERLRDSLTQMQQEAELQGVIANREQQRNLLLLGALAALLAAAFLTMRLRFVRQQRKIVEAEKEHEHAEAVRLQELDKLKTDLYTNITHEFRTPLTVISGMAAELKEHPEKSSEVSTIVQRNSSVLLNLVNQMLDLSKVESGNLDVNKVSGDVIEYIGYITQSFQSMAATKDITLHVINKDESLVMDYDPDKLMQILSNLLSNSIKFTQGGGNIYVTTSTNGRLDIEVRDTGIGIAPDKLPHVFDRFYQVADTQHKSIAGTGIGLALTKQLVDLIGGTIAVSSVPAKGTTFNVSLPITKEETDNIVDFDPRVRPRRGFSFRHKHHGPKTCSSSRANPQGHAPACSSSRTIRTCSTSFNRSSRITTRSQLPRTDVWE